MALFGMFGGACARLLVCMCVCVSMWEGWGAFSFSWGQTHTHNACSQLGNWARPECSQADLARTWLTIFIRCVHCIILHMSFLLPSARYIMCVCVSLAVPLNWKLATMNVLLSGLINSQSYLHWKDQTFDNDQKHNGNSTVKYRAKLALRTATINVPQSTPQAHWKHLIQLNPASLKTKNREMIAVVAV